MHCPGPACCSTPPSGLLSCFLLLHKNNSVQWRQVQRDQTDTLSTPAIPSLRPCLLLFLYSPTCSFSNIDDRHSFACRSCPRCYHLCNCRFFRILTLFGILISSTNPFQPTQDVGIPILPIPTASCVPLQPSLCLVQALPLQAPSRRETSRRSRPTAMVRHPRVLRLLHVLQLTTAQLSSPAPIVSTSAVLTINLEALQMSPIQLQMLLDAREISHTSPSLASIPSVSTLLITRRTMMSA